MTWRPLFRLARREIARSKARSFLIACMILVPVMVASAGATLLGDELQDSNDSYAESFLKETAGADALISVEDTVITQPSECYFCWGSEGERVPLADRLLTESDLDAVLTREFTASAVRSGRLYLEVSGKGRARSAGGVDFADPLLAGALKPESGRLPRAVGEALAVGGGGFEQGDTLVFADGARAQVVGVTARRSLAQTYVDVWLPTEALTASPQLRPVADPSLTWLLQGEIDQNDVAALNRVGGIVNTLARAEQADAQEAIDEATYDDDEVDVVALVALVLAMALLEIALLAGPAFAVSARRQAQGLAVLAATGARPQQLRLVVLFNALILGGLAAIVGCGAGIGAGLAMHRQFAAQWDLGPVQMPPLWVFAVFVAVGTFSAVGAALVPAWITSRQDPVAVLSGRRSLTAPRWNPIITGISAVVISIGWFLCWVGSHPGASDLAVPLGALVSVVGAIGLIPALLLGLRAILARAPFAVRFALRDSQRHGARTTPAIAAVMGVMAGVVALGIANASDQASYLDLERAPVTSVSWEAAAARESGDQLSELIAQTPNATLLFGARTKGALVSGYADVETMGSFSVVVAENSATLGGLPGLSQRQRQQVDDELVSTGLVIFGAVPSDFPARSTANFDAYDDQGTPVAKEVQAEALLIDSGASGFSIVVSPEFAEEQGWNVQAVGALLNQPKAPSGLEQELARIHPSTYVSDASEREEYGWVVFLVLGVAGGLTLLAGSVTATVLALNDARPDLATLSAVGADRGVRRRVAAGYALVIGLVGSSLGMVLGIAPGLAAATFLTGSGGPGELVTYEAPWALLASVGLGVPLGVAGLVALLTRSHAPPVARRL